MIINNRSLIRSVSSLSLFLIVFLFIGTLLSAETRGLELVASAVAGPDIKIGKQYVVLIAIDTYQEWNPLRNPVKDAKTIKAILQKRYYIDEFIELYNEDATSSGIRKLFSSLIEKIGPTDSVMIYYAGHGHLDTFNTGFWIPVDGGRDLDAQKYWIPNAQIRNFVSQMKARSVALISDSCFSGDLLNVSRGATPAIDSAYYKNALRYTARQALTSGASEAVPDESEFARQFKSILQSNTEACLDPLAIYDRLRRGVTQTLPFFGTMPGHETGGSYVLFLRDVELAQIAPAPVSFPDSASLLSSKISAEQRTLATLQTKYIKSTKSQHTNRTVRNASFITGGISAVAAGVLFFVGNSAMTSYRSASTSADAAAMHDQVSMYNTLFLSSAGLSAAGLALGGILFATEPKPAKIEAQVNASIDRLRVLQEEKASGEKK